MSDLSNFHIKKLAEHKVILIGIQVLVFIVCILVLARCHKNYSPSLVSGSYSYKNETNKNLNLPFRHPTKNQTYKLDFSLLINKPIPKIFQIHGNGCIQNFLINEKVVEELIFPACITDKSVKLNLSEYIKSGQNNFQIQINNYNRAAYFNLMVSKTDPGLILIQIIFYCLIILLSVQLWKSLFKEQAAPLICLHVGGVIVRILYLTITPTGTREHDYGGHLHYIRYMVENLSTPANGECHVCYHPSLYYFLNALWYKYRWFPGSNAAMIWNEIQMGSFLLSVLTLAVGLFIGTMLFKSSNQKLQLIIYGAILSFFPGLIFLSSRINNDVLLVLFSFLLLAAIVRWWKYNCYISLLATPVLMAFGLLTKKNILVLFPATLVAICLKKNFCWKRKISVCIAALIIIFSIQNVILPKPENAGEPPGSKTKWLKVENTFLNLTTFNPVQVIKHAYNGVGTDLRRRQYFLEYLYRSAFLGEFKFGDRLLNISRALLVLGMLLGVLAFGSIARELITNKQMNSLPILVTLISAIAAILYFRLKSPLACSQDFRYIPVVIIPFAYYIGRSLEQKPLWLAHLTVILSALFVISSVSFFIMLHL